MSYRWLPCKYYHNSLLSDSNCFFFSRLDDDEEKEEIEEEEGETSQMNFRIDDTSDDILPTFEEIPKNSIITIQSYDDDLHEQILEDTQPRFIIMFDPNPAFVRQVEVYRAKHPTIDVRVYFMLYENSVEEQNYLSLIKKEKESFEKLIHEKSVSDINLNSQIYSIYLKGDGHSIT